MGAGKLCLPVYCGKYRRTRNLRSRSFGFQRSTPCVNNSEIITMSPAFGCNIDENGIVKWIDAILFVKHQQLLWSLKLTLMRAGNYDKPTISWIDIRKIRETDEVITVDTSVINFIASAIPSVIVTSAMQSPRIHFCPFTSLPQIVLINASRRPSTESRLIVC